MNNMKQCTLLTYLILTRYCFEYRTADARLRIVSERVDIIDNLILSVSVTFDITMYLLSYIPFSYFSRFMSLCPLIQIGPPNSQFLKTKDKKTWTAKDVADSVLSDKSALVIELACLI